MTAQVSRSSDEGPSGRRLRPTEDGEPAPGESLSIGQLVRVLKGEFPNLSISKVRYLEDRGLLDPHRTPSGYRAYASEDLQRLRIILALQRDEFLPLDVIQERLERGTAASLGRRLRQAPAGATSDSLRVEERSLSWEEAAKTSGIPPSFLQQLSEYRLIEARRSDEGHLTETDLDIARMCHLLSRFGVEPRNLRLLRSTVEREAALLEQVVAGDLRSAHEDRRRQGERTLQDLASLLSQLVDHLLYKELRRLVG